MSTVAEVARQAGEAGDRGKTRITIRGTTFKLNERGWCARFVRQCHEAALGLPPYAWSFQARNAREMEEKLWANGKEVGAAIPGDIVCFNRDTGPHGHIGIYLGEGKFAENTSSKVRGPGTTISNLSELVSRITGYYRAAPVEGKQIQLPGSQIIADLTAEQMELWRDWFNDRGCIALEAFNHLSDQQKVYLRKLTPHP